MVIYLDYSSFSQVKGVIKRAIMYRGKEREEIPGCKEKIDVNFIKYTWNWRKQKRDEVISNLEGEDESKIIIFKNRRKLNNWYKKEFSKKINLK